MITTAEKKRILQMATVHGEIKIQNDWGLSHEILKFDAIEQNKNSGTPSTSCVERINRPHDGYVYLKCYKNHVELWACAANFKLSKKVAYKDLTILWCKYQGIPQQLAA